MEKQYVANQSVNFADQKAYVKSGDILTHHIVTKDMIVYRDGALVHNLHSISVAGIEQMVLRGWFSPIVVEAPSEVQVIQVEPRVRSNRSKKRDA
jgi:hypothetical protein